MPRLPLVWLCIAATAFLGVSIPRAEAFPRPGSAARLTLAGQMRHGPSGRDWRALVTLAFPLDRLWAPRIVSPAAVAVPPNGDDTPLEEPPPEPVVPEVPPPRGRGHPPGRSARTPRKPAPRSASEELLSAHFVRAVVERTLHVHGYGDTGRRLDSLAARSRSAAALPALWLRAARSTDTSLRLSPTLSDPERYTETGGADLWLEAKLSWDLDRLLFSADELAVERLRHQRAEDRARLVVRVLDALFSWHRARVEALRSELLPEEHLEALLQQMEAELTLDVLTDGWFSEQARARDAALDGDTGQAR